MAGLSPNDVCLAVCSYGGLGVSVFLIWKQLISPLLSITITLIGGGIGYGIRVFLTEGPNYNIIRDVEALQKSFDLTEAFGLDKADEDIATDHLSSVKYGLFLLLIGRFFINVKTLASHFWSTWVIDLPYGCESVAKFVEAGAFCVLSIQLLCCLLKCSCSNSGRRWQLVTQTRELAGFSSLTFLAFITPAGISHFIKQFTGISHFTEETRHFIIFIYKIISIIVAFLCVILYGGLGLAVLLSKMGDFDIRGMEAMGVLGMASEAMHVLMAREFGKLLDLKLVKLATFANQVISLVNVDKVEMERIQLFIFGREDSKYNQAELTICANYMEKVAAKIWNTPRSMLARSVALMTFGPDDLQKLTVHQHSEDIELKAASIEDGLLNRDVARTR